MRHALLLVGPLLAVLAACPAEEPAPQPPPDGGAGDGGGGSDGCADLSATGDCRFQGPGACPDGELCTVAPAKSCGGERCCSLPFECRPPVGLLPGGYLCSQDDDCAAGVCLFTGGIGSCLRPCQPGGATCPEGLSCVIQSLTSAASVHACIGEEDGAPAGGRTLCRHDGECVEGRYCRIFAATSFESGGAHGLCVPGARGGEAGRLCEAGGVAPTPATGSGAALSGLCEETGLCLLPCSGSDPEICNCRELEPDGSCRGARCAPPCGSDDECPSPLLCRPIDSKWIRDPDPDFAFRTCTFSSYNGTNWGCFDETDCCKNAVQRGGKLCCVTPTENVCDSPPSETTHCVVSVTGPRYGTVCLEPRSLAELGAPCVAKEECESGLCAPDGRCTSPCLVGVGDRCDELLPGTRCCGLQVGVACVPACRLDCDAGPTCGS